MGEPHVLFMFSQFPHSKRATGQTAKVAAQDKQEVMLNVPSNAALQLAGMIIAVLDLKLKLL